MSDQQQPQVRYVCGFMFHQPSDRVLLIRKARPAWQAGKLNGVGGKIEPGESAAAAMVREFREEAGWQTGEGDWTLRVVHAGPGHVVHFFRADTGILFAQPVPTDEPCVWVDRHRLAYDPTIPNLRWLVPLCLDDDIETPVNVHDFSDPNNDGATARSRKQTPS